MPSIYDLKPAFQRLLRPAAAALAGWGVTANQVTLAALMGSLALGAALAAWPGALWPLLLLPPFLFLRMALNAIDGLMAREHGQETPLGGLLNEVGDGISDAALYLPFALHPGLSAELAVAVVGLVVLALIGELVGLAAVGIGAKRRYDGPLGKSDRALAFGLLAVLLLLDLTGWWIAVFLWGLVVLSLCTIWNRGRRALGTGS